MRAKKKNITLTYEIDESIPDRLLGDETRLRQILVNLISNAVTFTEKGRIHVKVNLVMVKDREMHVSFGVQDTGIGIPEDRLDDIFNNFTQVDTSNTRNYGGTGLGLAICKNLVERLQHVRWKGRRSALFRQVWIIIGASLSRKNDLLENLTG